MGWISALRSGSIRKLVENNELQLSLFDKQDLAEISSDEFPGERLIACFNPLLADERARKRKALLAATEEKVQRIAKQVARRTKTPLLADEIALKVGRVINRHKVGKHFSLHIQDGVFRGERDEASIEQEAAVAAQGEPPLRCTRTGPAARPFTQDTQPTQLHTRVFRLLGM